jgi:hypothetical protein
MWSMENSLYVCGAKFKIDRRMFRPSVACRAFFMPGRKLHIRRSTPCGTGNGRKPIYEDLAAGSGRRFSVHMLKFIDYEQKRS